MAAHSADKFVETTRKDNLNAYFFKRSDGASSSNDLIILNNIDSLQTIPSNGKDAQKHRNSRSLSSSFLLLPCNKLYSNPYDFHLVHILSYK